MTESKEKTESEPKPELVDDFKDMNIDDIMPRMNVNTTDPVDEKACIVGDETIVGLYEEILENTRKDRESVDEVLVNFIDMVMNDGDSSSASKEAIVNLIKIKSDTSDKMAKIADLMTRIKLKERDTYPRYLAAQQNNKIIIEDKREFLKSIEKLAEKKKDAK